jgi:O-antigen/teichoic acid export membrane protein
LDSTSAPLGRFFKHSSIYAVGNVLNRLAAFLLLPIYTNYLSVAEYGAIELFYVISAVVAGLLSIGIAHATLRFYYEYDTEPERKAVVSTNFIVSFLITAVGAGLVSLWQEPIAQYVFGKPEYSRGVMIVLASLVLELSSQVCLAYIRAKEKSRLFVGISLAKLIIQVVANTYFVIYLSAGVEGVLFGNLLAVAAGWAFLTGYTLRQCGWRFEMSKAIPVLKYSFPFLLSTIAGLISANVDRFLINSMLSLQALGIYALALKFSGLLDNLIGEPFSRSYGAFRFSIMKDGDAQEVQARIVRYLLIGVAIVGLGIAYFARDLLSVMSEASYWPAADILPVLIIGSAIKVMVYPVQTGILYEKKTRNVFYIGLISALTSTVVNLIMIGLFGLTGACVAQVITAGIVLYVTNRISQRYLSVAYEYRKLLTIIIVTLVFYFLMLLLGHPPLHLAIPLKLLLLAGFLTILVYTGALTDDEIMWFRTVLSTFVKKG